MSKTIKVWVPEYKGELFHALTNDVSERSCWRDLSRQHLEGTDSLEQRGWTVQPYTLTKGHTQ
jgi:hypothetical protein